MEINKGSYFLFSGGEVHCKNVPVAVPSPIVLKDYTMNGLMALAQHVQIWKQNKDPRMRYVDLIIPYLPYARQDRWINAGEPFSLKLYCDMINSMEFNTVTVYDCHSDVGLALLNNCIHVPQWEIAKSVIPKECIDNPDVLFVSPDAGAYKKVSKLITDDNRIVIGIKKRDASGNVVQTGSYSPVPIVNKKCIIVDDICDGGRTFIELAKVLRSQGAMEVILYVTHGIFSKGLAPLWDADIHKIYTTNSFPFTPINVKEASTIEILEIC